MAKLAGGAIDTNSIERSQMDSAPLPAGVYSGIVVKTEQKDVKNNGVMVIVEFDITNPQEFANRKFWDRFNIINENADAVRIAQEGLADLGKACGIPVLEDDEQLIGLEVQMELKVQPAKAYLDKQGVQQAGKPQNSCTKYWPTGIDVDSVKADQKAAKAGGAPAGAKPTAASKPAAAATGTNRWAGAAKPAAAPAVVATPAAAPAQTAGTAKAPWKTNKA